MQKQIENEKNNILIFILRNKRFPNKKTEKKLYNQMHKYFYDSKFGDWSFSQRANCLCKFTYKYRLMDDLSILFQDYLSALKEKSHLYEKRQTIISFLSKTHHAITPEFVDFLLEFISV
jgi:hypothetical protein